MSALYPAHSLVIPLLFRGATFLQARSARRATKFGVMKRLSRLGCRDAEGGVTKL
jgi:hypothetical protein